MSLLALRPFAPSLAAVAAVAERALSSLSLPFDLRGFFFFPTPVTDADASETVSMLGDLEYAGVRPLFSGGKEVWRKGWVDEIEVVDIMEALRRLMDGAEEGISD